MKTLLISLRSFAFTALALACFGLPAWSQANLGQAKVGASVTTEVTVTFTTAGTLGSISMRLMGAENLDFTNAGGGTCAVGTAYGTGSECRVNVRFSPRLAGQRRGAVVLLDKSGNMLGTEYVQGTGMGPQAAILAGSGKTTGIASESDAPQLEGLAVDGTETVWQVTGDRSVRWALSNGTYEGTYPPIPSSGEGQLAFDGAGLLYYADLEYGYGHLVPTGAGGGFGGSGYVEQPEANCEGANFVISVATDGVGNAYLLNEDGGGGGISFSSGVCSVLPVSLGWYNNGNINTWASSLTVDPSGNFIASIASNPGYANSFVLYKESNQQGNEVNAQIVPELTNPTSPVSDGSGNLFTSANGDPHLPNSTQGVFLAALQPDGTYNILGEIGEHTGPLALDGNGNLFTDGGAYEFNLLNPSPVSMGSAGMGQSGPNKPINVANTGNAPLKIASITYPADFPEAAGISGECAAGQTVAVGAACTITTVFTPSAPLDGAKSQALSEEITLVSNSLNGSATKQVIPLTGTETLPVPTVTLSTSSNPAAAGSAVTFTASVTGPTGSAAPTGTVTFYDGSAKLGVATLTSGTATYQAAALANGNHKIVALYSGSATYTDANSPTLTQVMGTATPTISIASSQNPAPINTAVTFSAKVGGIANGSVPTGTVTFSNGTTALGTSQLSSGTATFATAALPSGSNAISASYAGNSQYSPAVSSPITEKITAPVGTAATPTFSKPTGTYTAVFTVTIADTTAGATIYYTTSGATPTASSTKYTGPIPVLATETLKAIAVASGYTASAVASASYTLNLPSAATPAIVPDGGSYGSLFNITISDATPGATIYYTTNGATPTTASAIYTAPFALDGTETIEAIAAAKGYANSAAAVAKFVVKLPVAATPTFKPAAGVYPSPQSVTITDATPGAFLYYTTDGTQPTTESARFEDPIPVSQSTTIKAFATNLGYANSLLGTAYYNIQMPYYNLPTGFIYQYGNKNPVAANLVNPSGLSIDGQGNLYFGNVTYGPIKIALMKRTPSGAVTNLGTVLDTTGGTIGIGPWEFSLAADLAGNVYYVTPPWNSPKGAVAGALYKFGTKEPLVNNLSYPAGIATDYAGNVYFGNLTTSPLNVELMEYTTEGDKHDLGSLFKTTGGIEFGGWAFDLAVDPDGNVLYNVPNTSTGKKGNGQILLFDPLKSQTLASGLNFPTGLSVDALGDIYFNDFDYGTNTVELKEIPKGGAVQTIGQTYKGGFVVGPWAFDVVAYRPPAAAPVFKPVSGTFTVPQSVTLSDSTPGAKIYYNINAANPPTTNSTLYTGPIPVTQSETISAIAVSPGYVPSSVSNGSYIIFPQTKTPVISPAAGTYANPVTVTITDATAGAAIYYTVNGATPTATSTPYKGPFTVSTTETVKAIAIAKGYTNSAVASSAYTVK